MPGPPDPLEHATARLAGDAKSDRAAAELTRSQARADVRTWLGDPDLAPLHGPPDEAWRALRARVDAFLSDG